MKSITISSLVIAPLLLASHLSPPQARSTDQKIPCTYIELRCPTYIVGGSALRVSADVVGAKQILGSEGAKLISYQWQVTAGRIIEGQNTSSILVGPVKNSESDRACITATVKVTGVEPTCENSKSCSVTFDSNCSEPLPFDQFGNISSDVEKDRLDKVAAHLLTTDSRSVMYIVAYAGLDACLGEAQSRADRAKAYLKKSHGIQDDRVITVDGGFRDSAATEIFIVPSNSCGPTPTPTLKTSDANIRGLCPKQLN